MSAADQSPASAEAAATVRRIPLATLVSLAMPLLAFLLPALPDLGVRIVVFAYFKVYTRIICAGLGVVAGIVGCVNGGSGRSIAAGLVGIVLNILTFVAAVVLAFRSNH